MDQSCTSKMLTSVEEYKAAKNAFDQCDHTKHGVDITGDGKPPAKIRYYKNNKYWPLSEKYALTIGQYCEMTCIIIGDLTNFYTQVPLLEEDSSSSDEDSSEKNFKKKVKTYIFAKEEEEEEEDSKTIVMNPWMLMEFLEKWENIYAIVNENGSRNITLTPLQRGDMCTLVLGTNLENEYGMTMKYLSPSKYKELFLNKECLDRFNKIKPYVFFHLGDNVYNGDRLKRSQHPEQNFFKMIEDVIAGKEISLIEDVNPM